MGYEMKGENVVVQKSFAFALRAVRLGNFLIAKRFEYILSKQLIRSGTSIGANIEEAMGGQSRADFYAKMTIAYKEARETMYWIRLLHASGYLKEPEATSLLTDIDEILKIIGSIQLSIKRRSPTSSPSIRHS